MVPRLRGLRSEGVVGLGDAGYRWTEPVLRSSALSQTGLPGSHDSDRTMTISTMDREGQVLWESTLDTVTAQPWSIWL